MIESALAPYRSYRMRYSVAMTEELLDGAGRGLRPGEKSPGLNTPRGYDVLEGGR
jgi:hypothetical protein